MGDKEKQPQAYCAWHPEKGWMLVTIAHDAFHCRDILEDQLDADGEGSVSDWFFRPVWFSDKAPMTEEAK